MMRGIVIAAFLAGAAAISGATMPAWLSLIGGNGVPSAGEDAAYSAETARRGEIVTKVQAAGTLNALVTVDVGSQISGLVTELYVDFNATVTEGQLLARVDPDRYEAKLAQAEAELEMAETLVAVQRAQVKRAQAELESAEARHISARAEMKQAEVALTGAFQEYERKRPLAEKRILTAGDWERVENERNAAVARATAAQSTELSHAAEVRAAEAALSIAEAQFANSLAQRRQRQALLTQARIDLDRSHIRAPVTGTVVNRAVSVGQTVSASLQSPVLFTIVQDLRQMQVEASVVEADVSRFAVGQPVTFSVDAYPGRMFRGAVRQIRKAPQIVQNVVTYVVVIDSENEDELLLPGMTANLQVVVAHRQDVLTVPNAALRFRPRQAGDDLSRGSAGEDGGAGEPGRVFVVRPDGTLDLVLLRLGITDGRRTEVLAGGLGAGDRVITGFAAHDGAKDGEAPLLLRFRLW